jgi:hypothetical protein
VTVVAGVAFRSEALLLADTRLAAEDSEGRPLVLRDVCQKLIIANGWSVAGFAGDLCLARHLLRGVVNRLRESTPDAADWLQEDTLDPGHSRVSTKAGAVHSRRERTRDRAELGSERNRGERKRIVDDGV